MADCFHEGCASKARISVTVIRRHFNNGILANNVIAKTFCSAHITEYVHSFDDEPLTDIIIKSVGVMRVNND